MNFDMELQLVPRSIVRVSGGRGLGWQVVPGCPPVLMHRSFVETGYGRGLGWRMEFPVPPPYPGRVVLSELQKIGDVHPVSTPFPSAEPKKSLDTDLEVPAVSTTATSGEEASSPIPPHPASCVVGAQLEKIGDVRPVSTPSPSAEPEKSADTDLEVPVVLSTESSGEEQSSQVPASSTAVPLSTTSSLPDKQVSRQSHHFDGAARRAWLKQVTFAIFRTWASSTTFTGTILIQE